MDAAGAVGTGWGIGTVAAEGVLKYDRGVYEERLAELRRIKQELDQHLETLVSIKGELPGFWDDMLGDKLSSTTQQWINNIQEADRKLQSMISTTEGLIADLDATLGNADSTLQDVHSAASAVSGLIDGVGSLK